MAKILIVDDDPVISELIVNALQKKGHKVYSSRTAQLGLAVMLKEEPDIAIIDYHMPIRSGLDLIKDVRSFPDLKKVFIIMLTGDGEPQVVSKAIELGVTDFIVKPIKISNLLERLDKILLTLNPKK